MMSKDWAGKFLVGLFLVVLVGGVLGVGKYWGFGFIETRQPNRVKVVGQAKDLQQSQVARVNAGMNIYNENKEKAVEEVNNGVEKISKAVKALGIKSEDIKTMGMSVWQQTETYYDNGQQKTRLGQWSVSNTIEVAVRDTAMVKDVMGVLTSSGVNNISGPYYSVEDQPNEMDESLRKAAYDDAVRKATQMAKLSGRSLGRVMSIEDANSSNTPVYYGMMGAGGGGGGEFNPGSSQVGRSLVVEFELE